MTTTIFPTREQTEKLFNTQEKLEREHAAWLDFCQELDALGIDINDQDLLCRAVQSWGEELVQLRFQEPEYAGETLLKRRVAYQGQYDRGTYPEIPG